MKKIIKTLSIISIVILAVGFLVSSFMGICGCLSMIHLFDDLWVDIGVLSINFVFKAIGALIYVAIDVWLLIIASKHGKSIVPEIIMIACLWIVFPIAKGLISVAMMRFVNGISEKTIAIVSTYNSYSNWGSYIGNIGCNIITAVATLSIVNKKLGLNREGELIPEDDEE